MKLWIFFVLKENEYENKEGRMKTVNVGEVKEKKWTLFKKESFFQRLEEFLSDREKTMTN